MTDLFDAAELAKTRAPDELADAQVAELSRNFQNAVRPFIGSPTGRATIYVMRVNAKKSIKWLCEHTKGYTFTEGAVKRGALVVPIIITWKVKV